MSTEHEAIRQESPRIKVTKDGPYLVTGNVPLLEERIVPRGKGYVLQPGRELPQSETYALCRCGKSKSKPFCDGSHVKAGFVGTETASRSVYEDRADLLAGPGIDMLDDGRCAVARFCHREKGTAWDLVQNSADPECRDEAREAASECPAGRLVAVDHDRGAVEPEYPPSVSIVQDPEKQVSAGIFVRGSIPIESADGHTYEVRNRVALCRCGASKNKPFCDARHIPIRFLDSE